MDPVGVCRRGTERSSRNERITVTYSCAEDDGRPIGIGFQEQVPNQSELLRSKAVVVSVGSKSRDHRGRWASESRAKANPRRRVDNHTCRQNRRRSIPLGSVRRVPDDRADGDRRIGGGSWTQASTRNCGNQILDHSCWPRQNCCNQTNRRRLSRVLLDQPLKKTPSGLSIIDRAVGQLGQGPACRRGF